MGLVMEMGGTDKMIYSFWQKGWIEIRVIENKGTIALVSDGGRAHCITAFI
jgi:hypothetical protein